MLYTIGVQWFRTQPIETGTHTYTHVSNQAGAAMQKDYAQHSRTFTQRNLHIPQPPRNLKPSEQKHLHDASATSSCAHDSRTLTATAPGTPALLGLVAFLLMVPES